LGYCQERLGRYDEAVETFEEALSLNPNDAYAYLSLGICHYREKTYQEAVAALQKCVSLQPTNFDGHAWLGYSLYMLHRYETAVISFQKALRIKPDDLNMHYWLGRSFAALRRYDEAANAFQEAIRINSNDFEANEWRGFSLMRLGRFGEATANLERAYAIKKGSEFARIELFSDYLLTTQFEKAYRLCPAIFAFGGGSLMLGYVVALTVLLRFSFRISPNPSPGLGFSFAWLALFFEGQIALIFCLGLLSLIKLSETFLFGITLAGIPVIFAAAQAFARQPWGQPFTWPLRLGTAKIMWLSLLGLVLALLFGSWCAEWVARWMHRPMTVQETIPLIKYALSANPVAAFLSVVVVGPIVEEILFRGLIYGALERRLRVAGAILASSFMFAFVHLQPTYFIPIFCLGAVLGWARWKTGSLGLPILVHVLNNGVSLLLLKFFETSA
jgi:tetratricopeptide (TPR) repeat protein